MRNHTSQLLGMLGVIVLTIASNTTLAQVEVPMQGDRTDISRWIDIRFAKGTLPPFSFVYDERPSEQFIRTWQWSRNDERSDEQNVIARRFTYHDPQSGMQVVCEVKGYIDMGAVEWVLHFTNTSNHNSGQLSAVKVVDMKMLYPTAGQMKIHYAEGNKISKADYAPRSEELRTGITRHTEPVGGRSSEEAFPFFNLESEASHQGVMVAIGWSGTWFTDICKTDPQRLTLASGMAGTDLYLFPKEQIRTPSIAMLFWSGDRMTGHNRFRRLILTHHSRKIDGRTARYPLCSGFNYRDPAPCSEYSCITAEWAAAMIHRYAFFGLKPDVFWLDAGWNTGSFDLKGGNNWATTNGNWTVDKQRFPNGLKPIADAAHEVGSKFMVWFEPERVVKGTQWAVEHPEWMLEMKNEPDNTWLLLDLGNDSVCQWLCNYYGDMIAENGIDYYRQDFNMQPARYWAAYDTPNRRGIKEIRHIENLYKFWDYLLERFPDMLIDNCASGGKRLDWETVGRSAPLWRSDYYHYNDPDGYQCHTYGLNFFLPIHGTGILLSDQYSFRSSISSALIFNWKITEKENSIEQMQQRIAEYREIQPYYYEDYYPLTGTGDLTGDNVWLAYQMHRPSDGSGIIVAFRRSGSVDSTCTVQLGGLDAEASYTLTDSDTHTETILTGRALADGLTLHLNEPQSSLLLKYRKNR